MKSNLTNAHKAAVVVSTLIVGTIASYFFLNFLIYWVIGGLTESSALDDLMVGYTYHIASFLLGCTLTVLFWRKVMSLTAKHGIPGLVPKENCGDNKPACIEKVQVYLNVSIVENGKRKLKTYFTGQFPVAKLQETLFGQGKPKLSLVSKQGVRLTLARSEYFNLSQGLEDIALFVKLVRKKKTLFHFETLAKTNGSFTNNSDREVAQCVYSLIHIGCDDTDAIASLVFTGKTKPMRSLFFSKK